jgi:hypothetical protein
MLGIIKVKELPSHLDQLCLAVEVSLELQSGLLFFLLPCPLLLLQPSLLSLQLLLLLLCQLTFFLCLFLTIFFVDRLLWLLLLDNRFWLLLLGDFIEER